MKTFLHTLCVIFVLLFQCNFSLFSQQTWTVPTDYPTVQEAINTATNGDTILILPGEYADAFDITKNLVVLGEDRESCVFNLSADSKITFGNIVSASLENLSVIKSSGTSFGNSVEFGNGVNATIRACKFVGANTAISLFNDLNGVVTIERCLFIDNTNGALNLNGTNNEITVRNCMFDYKAGNRMINGTFLSSATFLFYNNIFLKGPRLFFLSGSGLPASMFFANNIIASGVEELGIDSSAIDNSNFFLEPSVSGDDDYRPTKTSYDLINMGWDESIDPDGTIGDIGLHHYPILDEDGDGYFTWNEDPEQCDCNDAVAEINPGQEEDPTNGVDDNCDGVAIIDMDGDGFSEEVDCDDTDATIFPGAACDDGDFCTINDTLSDDCLCSGQFEDTDSDGSCDAEDCNPQDPNIYPGATEIAYNGIDDDCNPETLDDDLDMDGFNLVDDCDDTNPDINPMAIEIPYNGIDEDCNPATPDNDLDLDGFDVEEDCDDMNPDINPEAPEIANNNIDEDCDGEILIIDEDGDGFNSDEDCDDLNAEINPDAVEIPNNDIDEDCDGEALIIDEDGDGFNSDEDCDDLNADINPNAEEVPNNDIDENCDGEILIIDEDGDGFNSDEDCDDMNADINPDAEEVPNNDIDEDCDGEALMIDEDGDGFNSDEDCDDMNPDINPDAEEIANNGIDEDCDGEDLISSTQSELAPLYKLYPNPVTDFLTVQCPSLSRKKIIVYDAKGIEVKRESTNDLYLTLDCRALSTGIYILTMVDEEGHTFSQKIAKL